MTPEQLLGLKLDGNLTLRDLLEIAGVEGQLSTKDMGDDSLFPVIAQKIIDAVKASE